MEKRRIKMQDGRYLIFYTFADERAMPRPRASEKQDEAVNNREPEAKPEAEEERSV